LSYIHNEEADFATSELARLFVQDSSLCYQSILENQRPTFSAFATQEPSSTNWPLADGVVSLHKPAREGQDNIAVEYKRTTEGVHGLLTAIGQTLSYINKGYNGAVMVIPREYTSHSSPAEHVASVLETNQIDDRIGIFDYLPPDKNSPYPFNGKLRCIRPMTLGEPVNRTFSALSKPKTQWVHMREGSTTRDVIYKYLKSAVRLSCGGEDSLFTLPQPLVDAVERIAPTANIYEYLSYTSDNTFNSRTWRDFWFTNIATNDVLTPFISHGGLYSTPSAFTKVMKDDGSGFSQIFEGRSNGLKEFLVNRLVGGLIDENETWEAMAKGFVLLGTQNKQGVRERAHSYREDVDSAVAQLRWVDNSGRPTDAGYKFVNICERYGGANSAMAREYFGATLIQTGHYGTFLHYIHRLSEQMFTNNPLEFTVDINGQPEFTEDSYWEYLGQIQDHLVDDLRVMYKAPGRNRARTRTIFQSELTFLRKYGFLSEARNQRYRLGVGLPINWVKVHEAIQLEL
jgi:hypothetical protein